MRADNLRGQAGAASINLGRRKEDERRLLSDGGIEMNSNSAIVPAWVSLCEELQEEMARIGQKVQELQRVRTAYIPQISV